jgi:hypothetical protein
MVFGPQIADQLTHALRRCAASGGGGFASAATGKCLLQGIFCGPIMCP